VSRPALGHTKPPVQRVPGVLSAGLKRGRGVMLTTHPHLVPTSRMSRSYISSPLKRFHSVQWDSFRRKTWLGATLSTTNPRSTDPEPNPGLRGERSEANSMSHGTANLTSLLWDQPDDYTQTEVCLCTAVLLKLWSMDQR
jgi:hypothetical protein